MKLKRIFGVCTAIASMALMTAAVHAATISAGAVTQSEKGADVVVPIYIEPSGGEASTSVNGYIIKLQYDDAYVTPVLSTANEGKDKAGLPCYATVGDSVFSNGVLVCDESTNTNGDKVLAVAWANSGAVSVTEQSLLASITFNVDEDATDDIPVSVEVTAFSKTGTSASDTVTAGNGVINLAKAVTVTYGDINNDGKIDATDASLALQHAGHLTTLEGDAYTAANVNGDEKVDATDASFILQYAGKVISKFPVEG